MKRLGSAHPDTQGDYSQLREVQTLRDEADTLRQQLMRSEHEAGKLADQLNCLILLVKQAWAGDHTAAMHVAKIVGAAMPEYDVRDENNVVVLTATPKSRAVNNWALLTIGLLNREYKMLESEMQERQDMYLHSRAIYLQEQLQEHRRQEELQDEVAMAQKSHQNKLRRQISIDRPPSGVKSKQAGKPLYRPGRVMSAKSHSTPVAWSDLFADPDNHADKAFQGLYATGRERRHSVGNHGDRQEVDRDRMDVAYDSPTRYAQFGLFDPETELPVQEAQRRRPVSAVQQKTTTQCKPRPQSAVQKGERPLKYETTVPVTGKPRRVQSATMHHSLHGNKAKSPGLSHSKHSPKPQHTGSHTGEPNMSGTTLAGDPQMLVNTSENPYMSERPQMREAKTGKPQMSEFERRELERQRELLQRQAYQGLEDGEFPLEIRIRKAESVVEFEGDLLSMADMERQFKTATLELQRKLGISESGIV